MTEPQRELDCRLDGKCGPQGNGSLPHAGAAADRQPRQVDRGSGKRCFALHDRRHASARRVRDDRYQDAQS